MDAEMFDRLAKALTVIGPRRGAIGGLAAALAAAGMASPATGCGPAGRRHRRRTRHRHNHDNRKGKRTGGKPKPRRDDPPFADCTKPGTWGQPCARTAFNQILRCCDGSCPSDPTCVPAHTWTRVTCHSEQECRANAAQCCTRETFCDDEEALCFCASSMSGDPCAFDRDCDVGVACVCGHCQ